MSNYRLSLISFLVVEVLAYYVLRDMNWVYVFLLSTLVLYLGMLLFFSFNLKYNFYTKAITNAKKGHVVLGFDDGPDPIYTPMVLDMLKEHNAKAIFFLIGEKAAKKPDLVKRILNDGHVIGNHSQHHYYTFGFLDYTRVSSEIMMCSKTIEGITSVKTEYFRPPFGIMNPIIARFLRTHKYKVIGWNLRTYDVVNTKADRMLKRLIKKSRSGSSILLHDRVPNTVEILPKLLENLYHKGLVIYPEFEN